MLIEKLPRVLQLARTGSGAATLRQKEDIRQLNLLCRHLEKQYNNNPKTSNHDKKGNH